MKKNGLPQILSAFIAINFLTTGVLVGPSAYADTNLPAMGEGTELTTSEERRVGDQMAREIYRDPQFLDDPILYEYVNGIWQELVAAAKQRGTLTVELQERFAWQVMLIQDGTVNAFALPGGYMGVQTGLIGVVGSRDELASVLAHELSHITQRHIARMIAQQKRMTPVMIAGMLLGALAASKNPAAAQALMIGGSAAMVQSQLNFSRDMEREADRTGMGLMQPAGYVQSGFVTMFEKLQQANRMNDNGSWPYLRTHPLTTERIADMHARLPTGLAKQKQDDGMVPLMMGARAKVLSKPGLEVMNQWTALPEAPEFQRQTPSQQAGGWYLAAMAHSRMAHAGQASAAADKLDALTRGHAEAERQVQLLRADIALQAREPQRALAALTTLEQAVPTTAAGASVQQHKVTTVSNAMTGEVSEAVITRGSDKSLSIGDLDPALAAQHPAQAVPAGMGKRTEWLMQAQALAALPGGSLPPSDANLTIVASALQTWVATQPKDGAAWQALATMRRLQNQPLRAIRADAEARAAQYDYAAAVDRLRAGQDMARSSQQTADYYEASIIDTRLRELQSLAKEQATDK